MKDLSAYLDPLNLPGWRYFPEVGSTNDLALAWAQNGAEDGALILADRQTAGRGRAARRWVTNPGSALALSLVLRPKAEEARYLPRFAALAALGLVGALEEWGLEALVKWPNDVLLDGKKVAGVLVENIWQGEDLEAVVVGMGVNVTAEAVPPEDELRFPATALELQLGQKLDRWAVLAGILQRIKVYRAILPTDALMTAWNAKLAFKGSEVAFRFPNGQIRKAQVLAIRPDGRLALQLNGESEPSFVVDGEVTFVGRGGTLKD